MRTPLLALLLFIVVKVIAWFDFPDFTEFEVH